MCATAHVILFYGALRGGEVFLVEGSELVRRISEGKSYQKHTSSRGGASHGQIQGREWREKCNAVSSQGDKEQYKYQTMGRAVGKFIDDQETK